MTRITREPTDRPLSPVVCPGSTRDAESESDRANVHSEVPEYGSPGLTQYALPIGSLSGMEAGSILPSAC